MYFYNHGTDSVCASVTPRITFVRHAQGLHNVSTANLVIQDPELTPFGAEQCRNLARVFPNRSAVDLLVYSPLRRTINTGLLIFEQELASRKLGSAIALPELQETSGYPCDTGSDPDVLKRDMLGKPVDLSLVRPGWNSKTGRWTPKPEAFRERTKQARLWLKARSEKNIVVVSHGAILHYLTEDWSDFDPEAETGWKNVEFRSYDFKDGANETASLVETDESKSRRKTLNHPSVNIGDLDSATGPNAAEKLDASAPIPSKV